MTAWDGKDRREGDIPGRVLVLEEQIKVLRIEFHDGLSNLNKSLSDLSSLFVEKTNTPWPTLIAASALMLTLIGAVGAAYIAPISVGMGYQEKITELQNKLIQEKFDALRTENELNSRNILSLEKESTSGQEKFKEIETQIGWMRDISNIQKVDSWFRMAVMWQKVFPGTEMPMPTAPTVGPGKNNS